MLSLSLGLKQNADKKPGPISRKRVWRKIELKTKTVLFRTVSRICGNKGALNQ